MVMYNLPPSHCFFFRLNHAMHVSLIYLFNKLFFACFCSKYTLSVQYVLNGDLTMTIFLQIQRTLSPFLSEMENTKII